MCKNNSNEAKKRVIMKVKIGWNDFQFLVKPEQYREAMDMMTFINSLQVVEEKWVGLKEQYVLCESTNDMEITIGNTSLRLVSPEEVEKLGEERKKQEADEKAAKEAALEAKRLADEAAALAQAQADEETMVNESVAETV